MPSVHKLEDFLEEFVLFVFAVMMMMVVVATMALLLLLFRFWSLVLYGPGELWTPYLAEEYLKLLILLSPPPALEWQECAAITRLMSACWASTHYHQSYTPAQRLALLRCRRHSNDWLFNLSTRFLSLFCVAITNKIPVSGYLRSQDVYLSRNSGVERSKECVLASW